MPIFKGSSSKSSPKKALEYILDEKKASLVDSFYLDDSRSYAEQFKETAKLWDKAKSKDSRKYYHFKLSFDVADNQRGLTPQKVMEMARELTAKGFPSSESVLAVHTDTEHLHAHIIVNSVRFDNGKMLQISPQKYTRLKDLANTISEQHGFGTVDFRKPSKVRQTTAERQIIAKGKTSWKEELREVIDLAKRETSNIVDFEKFLKDYGITLTRNTAKSISYLHPQQKQAIRGERLGADYTKGAILDEFSKQNDRSSSWEQTGAVPEERGGTSTESGRTIDVGDEFERRKRATAVANIEVERRKREESQQDYELQQAKRGEPQLEDKSRPNPKKKHDVSL
jgi:hypothetical protein